MEKETVAANLRLMREARGLQQQELAALAGVSKSAVSRTESATTTPRSFEMGRLAGALGVPMEVLMTPDGAVNQLYAEAQRRPPSAPRPAGHDAIRVRSLTAGAAGQPQGLPADGEDDDAFIVRVVGECLTPQIQPGNRLEMSASRQPRVGDIVSVVVAGERHLKRVMRRNGEWELWSNYGRMVIPAGEVIVEGVMNVVLEVKGGADE